MADTIKTNLGPVTAYADAKAHGYTGTREEFGVLLANAGLNLKAAETAKEGAEAAKQAAETAQQAAAENQKNAGTQAANAKASADTAAEQAAVAKESAADAANSATAAQESETNAGLSATAAANAEAAAKQAQNSAETAKADAEAAKTAAGNSADAAANSAADAKKTLESIPTDYSTLSGKVDKNTSGISELKEDKISKFYASSQGDTNLPDSDAGRLVDLKLYGKSEQKQYSGKNLLNSTLGTTTENGITVTSNSDGSYKIKGTSSSAVYLTLENSVLLTKNVTYKLRGVPSGLSGNVTIEMDTAPYYGDHGDGVTMIFDVDTSINIRIYVKENTSVDCLLRPMLTTDLTATYDDYEPYVGGIPSPNPEYPQEIKSVVKPVVTISDGKGKQQTAALPYTLNAIPVSYGGNVTIDGQQYVADYVDVERGKLVRMVKAKQLSGSIEMSPSSGGLGWVDIAIDNCDTSLNCLLADSYTFIREEDDAWNSTTPCVSYSSAVTGTKSVRFYDTASTSVSTNVMYPLATPTETDLTADEIAAFKALVSYYPVTNVSTTSDQLDGYTVFNYPISLANGWNYVKQQIGDTRDYLYDIDLVTAEAYVNSAYATALAEMGV